MMDFEPKNKQFYEFQNGQQQYQFHCIESTAQLRKTMKNLKKQFEEPDQCEEQKSQLEHEVYVLCEILEKTHGYTGKSGKAEEKQDESFRSASLHEKDDNETDLIHARKDIKKLIKHIKRYHVAWLPSMKKLLKARIEKALENSLDKQTDTQIINRDLPQIEELMMEIAKHKGLETELILEKNALYARQSLKSRLQTVANAVTRQAARYELILETATHELQDLQHCIDIIDEIQIDATHDMEMATRRIATMKNIPMPCLENLQELNEVLHIDASGVPTASMTERTVTSMFEQIAAHEHSDRMHMQQLESQCCTLVSQIESLEKQLSDDTDIGQITSLNELIPAPLRNELEVAGTVIEAAVQELNKVLALDKQYRDAALSESQLEAFERDGWIAFYKQPDLFIEELLRLNILD